MSLCSLPSHSDSGLGDMICQWDSRKFYVDRGMKSTYALLLWTLSLRCEKAEAGLLEGGREYGNSAYCYQKEHKAAFLLIGRKEHCF